MTTIATDRQSVSIREFNDVDELLGLRDAWREMLAKTPRASFFQSLAWLEQYCRHAGPDRKLRALVAYKGQRPIGALPLFVRREPTRLGTSRVVSYPLDDWGSFYGPLGDAPLATLEAGLRHLRQTRRDWDVIDLRWIDNDRVDQGRTERALQSAGLAATRSRWGEASFIELSGSWDEYWMSRTSKWRNNVRRNEKKLARQGEVRHVRYRPKGGSDADPRWDLYDACLQIAGASWQGASTTGTTLTHATIRNFLRDVHAAAARDGALDVNLLYLDETPVAFAYNYFSAGKVVGIRMGYDPQCSRDGAGTVLTARMIEDSFRRGDREIDLGLDHSSCKRYWQTSQVTSYHYCHYPLAAPRAQLLRLKRWFDRRRAAGRPDDLRSLKKER